MADKLEEPIWVVADSNFPTKITYIHRSFGSAKAESIRLANTFPGKKFIVFQSVCAVESQKIIETEYQDGCSIPF